MFGLFLISQILLNLFNEPEPVIRVTRGPGTGIARLIIDKITGADAKVILESVNILVKLFPREDDDNLGVPRGETETTYIVSNQSERDVIVNIGFPAIRAMDDTRDWGRLFLSTPKSLHRVTFDGNEVEGKVVSEGRDDCDEDEDEYNQFRSWEDEPKPCVYKVKLKLQSGKKHKIVHYFSGAKVRNEKDWFSLEIDMSGQASWFEERARSIKVDVEFNQSMSYCIATNKKEGKYDASKRRFTWSCSDCGKENRLFLLWVSAEDKEHDALGKLDRDVIRGLLVEGDDVQMKVIKDMSVEVLEMVYNEILASRRGISPVGMFEHHKYCKYYSDKEDRGKYWLGDEIDGNITLKDFSAGIQPVLRLMDEELRKRGIRHQALQQN